MGTELRVNILENIIGLFGSLNKKQYLRHFIFGLIVFLFFIIPALSRDESIPFQILMFSMISTLLYPYSRYAYEKIIGFIIGDNIIFTNILVLVISKSITILFCWFFALFGAPVGLLWLYLAGRS